MKSLVSISSFISIFIAANALASVKVGDVDVYRSFKTLPSGQIEADRKDINTVTSVDEKSHTYIFESTHIASVGTAPSAQSVEVRETDFISNCETKFNGVLETVTVPAGTFQACKITEKFNEGYEGFGWFANEPIVGLVKQQGHFTDSEQHTYVSELVSVQH